MLKGWNLSSVVKVDSRIDTTEIFITYLEQKEALDSTKPYFLDEATNFLLIYFILFQFYEEYRNCENINVFVYFDQDSSYFIKYSNSVEEVKRELETKIFANKIFFENSDYLLKQLTYREVILLETLMKKSPVKDLNPDSFWALISEFSNYCLQGNSGNKKSAELFLYLNHWLLNNELVMGGIDTKAIQEKLKPVYSRCGFTDIFLARPFSRIIEDLK